MRAPPCRTFELKDTAARLRFAPPTRTPPYRSVHLLLKQCDVQRLDPTARQALTLFSSFSETWEQNRGRHIREAKEMLASLSPRGGEYEVRSDRRPDRRFSGDGYLSRSRYFSVCRDDGVEGGTMLRELTVYHDPMGSGPLRIDDLTEASRPTEDYLWGIGASPRDGSNGILVSIPPYTATQHDWLHDAVTRWETMTVLLPVRITRQRFERVIDLRDPRVAGWFTYELTRLRWITGDGSESRAFPNKAPLDEFTDLLPSLMVQYQGGGNCVTRVAGQWLRSLGADALVFPSARSDSWVEVDKHSVKDFYGWNLVDYRGASPARQQTSDLTPTWTTKLSNEIDEMPQSHQADAFLDPQIEGRARGSWSWRNIEVSNLAARLLASALYLYQWAWDGVTDEQRTELARVLGAEHDARTLVASSAWFIRAFLGDERVRREIAESLAETPSHGQPHLVNLTETFRRMDARLAAGRSGGLG